MIEFVCFTNEHDYQPSKFHAGLEVCRICKVTRPTKRAADWRVRRGLKVKFRNPPTANANRWAEALKQR